MPKGSHFEKPGCRNFILFQQPGFFLLSVINSNGTQMHTDKHRLAWKCERLLLNQGLLCGPDLKHNL